MVVPGFHKQRRSVARGESIWMCCLVFTRVVHLLYFPSYVVRFAWPQKTPEDTIIRYGKISRLLLIWHIRRVYVWRFPSIYNKADFLEKIMQEIHVGNRP